MDMGLVKTVPRVALIVCLSLMVSSAASATTYKSHGWSSDSWSALTDWGDWGNWDDGADSSGWDNDEDTDTDYNWSSYNHTHYRGCGHSYDHESSIPEPSAALLFAAGGLIVARGIRNRETRKK